MKCTRTTTTFSCGHNIQAERHHCPASTRPSCTASTKNNYIHDTCSDSDPERLTEQERQKYEWKHSQLMREYIKAHKEGDMEMMKLVEEFDAKILQECKANIFRISLSRQDPEVQLSKAKERQVMIHERVH